MKITVLTLGLNTLSPTVDAIKSTNSHFQNNIRSNKYGERANKNIQKVAPSFCNTRSYEYGDPVDQLLKLTKPNKSHTHPRTKSQYQKNSISMKFNGN